MVHATLTTKIQDGNGGGGDEEEEEEEEDVSGRFRMTTTGVELLRTAKLSNWQQTETALWLLHI